MNRNEQYYDRYDRDKRNQDQNNDRDSRKNLSNYLSRYESRGNYYGMPSEDYEYRNVRSSERSDYGNQTSGPVSVGYNAGSNPRSGGNINQYNNQNSYGRDRDDREDYNYNRYSSGTQQGNRDNDDQYRYGDPNPYMNNNRNGGYERTRGTGWGQESNRGDNDNDRYSRQDNSYTYGGQGRRYDDFGRDEQNNYGHQNGYNKGDIDMYNDRGDHDYERMKRDHSFGNTRMSNYYDRYDEENDDFRYSGRIQDSNDNRSQQDNYATGMYSSNRAYLSDQDSQDDQYNNNSSKLDRRHKSGPDYSKSSSMSDYGRGEFRG